MNIEIRYLYRDGGNNKSGNSVVFGNPLNLSAKEVEARLLATLDSGDSFIAEQVHGLPSTSHFMAGYDATEMDHCWHELTDVSATREPASSELTINEVIASFEKAAQDGWEEFDVLELYE